MAKKKKSTRGGKAAKKTTTKRAKKAAKVKAASKPKVRKGKVSKPPLKRKTARTGVHDSGKNTPTAPTLKELLPNVPPTVVPEMPVAAKTQAPFLESLPVEETIEESIDTPEDIPEVDDYDGSFGEGSLF